MSVRLRSLREREVCTPAVYAELQKYQNEPSYAGGPGGVAPRHTTGLAVVTMTTDAPTGPSAQDQVVQSAGAYVLGGAPQFPFSLGIVD